MAEAFEREQETKQDKGTYVAKTDRKTIAQIAESFLKECRARNRRTSTLLNYESILDNYILPRFGVREAGTVRKAAVKEWLGELLQSGKSVELVNRIVRVFRTLLFHALVELEVTERNVLQRFKPYERAAGRRTGGGNRGAFTEDEVNKLLAAAKPQERAFVGVLVFTGMRPGELFALTWEDVDLTAGSATITRTWDWRGKRFTEPKTDAGNRTIALSGWLVEALEAHRKLVKPSELIFATRNDGPLNPANVRRDLWLPLIRRAGIRRLDMYPLRSTCATLGRVAGETSCSVTPVSGGTLEIH